MSASKVKVHVIVPNQKRVPQKMGVYVHKVGVFLVEIPKQLRSLDEFEVSLDESKAIPSKYEIITIHSGLKPGTIFKNKAPNGRSNTICCPPDIKEFDDIIVPWGDFGEHMVLQAEKAPPAPEEEEVAPPTQPVSKRNQKPTATDFELGIALSLSAASAVPASSTKEEEDFQKALQQSLVENIPKQNQAIELEKSFEFKQKKGSRSAKDPQGQRKIETNKPPASPPRWPSVKSSEIVDEEEMMARAIQESLAEAQKQFSQQLLAQQTLVGSDKHDHMDSFSSHSPQQHNSKEGTSVLDDDDDELLRRAVDESLFFANQEVLRHLSLEEETFNQNSGDRYRFG